MTARTKRPVGKTVKAWAIIRNGKIDSIDARLAIYPKKKYAEMDCWSTERIARVEIREIK